MNYYLILLFIFYLVSICYYFKKGKKLDKKKKYYIAIIILLTVFLVLRDPSVGIDTRNYKSIFDFSHRLDFIELFSHERHEIGFKYYTKILSVFNSYYIYLAITAVLSMIGVYYFIKDNSKNYFESFLIFICFNFYGYYFGILRQVLAISILLYAIKYVRKKEVWKFLSAVVIASMFHRTALVFIPVYFVRNVRITNKMVYIWGGLISIFLIFRKFILSMILSFYTPGALDGKAGNGYIMLIFLIGLSLVAFYYRRALYRQSNKNILFVNMIFIATLIQTISTIYGNVYRVTLYYAFAMIPLIPNIIFCIKEKKIQLGLRIAMNVSLIAYFAYMTFKLINYVPYKFVF